MYILQSKTTKLADRKGIYIMIPKNVCHYTTFYSIFKMSSRRKHEIRIDLPKITKIK